MVDFLEADYVTIKISYFFDDSATSILERKIMLSTVWKIERICVHVCQDIIWSYLDHVCLFFLQKIYI